MNQQYLHFTLGPVQGFVSQARRTRDFWAGSFLLSWLSAKAMVAIEDQGGAIVMPFTHNDPLLARVKRQSGQGPHVGSLPNNFIARIPNGLDGKVAEQAVQQAWMMLADQVWQQDHLDRLGVNHGLWRCQIEQFWDMAWVISHSDDASVLAQRKNWRSYMPPESMGDKCTMMGEWQELSGAAKPNPKQQRHFWARINGDKGLDLRENERLCAIAYVKRRFVHVWNQMEGHTSWALPISVPSTSYMAALHWLEALIKAEPQKEAVTHFARLANHGEYATRIACISQCLNGAPPYLKALADIDGRDLFNAEYAQETALDAARQKMLTTVEQFDVPLSPFYAVLMMDGDNLGETKGAMKDATALSEALALFTQDVPDIVKKHHGFLIYAGGDDVLAILSLEDALACAAAIRTRYMDIFSEKNVPAGKYSISAAIEYAHMTLPLTMILQDVHSLIDAVAKDGTGRDALACRVWKPGGVQQTWAAPWDILAYKKGDDLIAHATDMLKLVKEMGQQAKKRSDVGYASKLLYRFRETLMLVMPAELPEKGNDISLLAENIKGLHLDKLLETAYLSSGLLDGWSEKEEGMSKLAYVRKQIKQLMPLMRLYNKKGDWNGLYSSDGALLLRFLAQKGVERS